MNHIDNPEWATSNHVIAVVLAEMDAALAALKTCRDKARALKKDLIQDHLAKCDPARSMTLNS